MQHKVVEREDDDEPTVVEKLPSGKWLVGVGRAAVLIRNAIERLEPHAAVGDVAMAITDLRSAAALAGEGGV